MKIEHYQNNYQMHQAGTPRQNTDLSAIIAKKTADFAVNAESSPLSPSQARKALFQAVDAADNRLEKMDLHIRLRVGDKSERLQVEVFNPKNGEVIRRIPPDEIIRLAESIEEMIGLILDRSL